MKKFKSSGRVLIGAALAVCAASVSQVHAAELIYGFDDPTISGFTGNSATVSQSTTTGVTQGTGALLISNRFNQTYGGAITSTVPADFYNSSSFNVTVTITQTPVAFAPGATAATPVYFDLVPIFFSTDGEIDPDLSNPANFINVGGVAPGTYTYTVNLAAYFDPEGNLATDSTPGQILAADSAFDATQTPATTDAITGFQLTVEHGNGSATAGGPTNSPATTLYADNLTVPSAAIPEPASLSLLGLGGLALLGRRRVALDA